MRNPIRYLLAIGAAFPLITWAQDTTLPAFVLKVPNGYYNRTAERAKAIGDGLDRQTAKALARFQQKEARIRTALYNIDHTKTDALLGNDTSAFARFRQKVLGTEELRIPYVPGLDSIHGALAFLSLPTPGTPVSGMENLSAALKNVDALSGSLGQADAAKQFLEERQAALAAAIARYSNLPSGIGRELAETKRELYYYKQRISDAKATLNDPQKVQEQVLKQLQKIPAFRDWMQQNGQLATLFGNGGGSSVGIAGLQTQQGVLAAIQARVGAGGLQLVQQQVQAGMASLQSSKDRIQDALLKGLPTGSGGSTGMPDFRPNGQKTKSFLERLEYGLNVQSQRSNGFIPSTSDLAATLGYKLNDRMTMGAGLAYKMGWGSVLDHIHLSSQGIGLRSYLDIKAKGSIWLSGGYERNYMQAFSKLPGWGDRSKWQESGLLGLTKKMKMGKKTSNMQLLWDFLSYRQVPAAPAIKFRLGYTF